MPEGQSLIGQTVSHYRIVEKGTVAASMWRTKPRTRGWTFVALKFLPDEVAHGYKGTYMHCLARLQGAVTWDKSLPAY